jgi:hypothetical protein
LYSLVWLVLLLGSSTVLLSAEIARSILSKRAKVPDVLGYVASSTWNNGFLRLPQSGAGVLDAMHRIRLLWDLRVSVGDVHGDDDVGRLTLAVSRDVQELEKGRKYT